MATKNTGGWKTCSRGHKYRGAGPCPVCYPGSRKRRSGAIETVDSEHRLSAAASPSLATGRG